MLPATPAIPFVNPDDIISMEECARRLGVSRRWVYERTRRRSQDPIPHTKFGKKTLRFSWQRISEWWCAHEHNVVTKAA
jgi:excisionase family DNA binding protein